MFQAFYEEQRPTRADRLNSTVVLLSKVDHPLPLRAIAMRQGLKVTPYLRDLLATLVQDGYADVQRRQANGFEVDLYSITEAGRVLAAKIKAQG